MCRDGWERKVLRTLRTRNGTSLDKSSCDSQVVSPVSGKYVLACGRSFGQLFSLLYSQKEQKIKTKGRPFEQRETWRGNQNKDKKVDHCAIFSMATKFGIHSCCAHEISWKTQKWMTRKKVDQKAHPRTHTCTPEHMECASFFCLLAKQTAHRRSMQENTVGECVCLPLRISILFFSWNDHRVRTFWPEAIHYLLDNSFPTF